MALLWNSPNAFHARIVPSEADMRGIRVKMERDVFPRCAAGELARHFASLAAEHDRRRLARLDLHMLDQAVQISGAGIGIGR